MELLWSVQRVAAFEQRREAERALSLLKVPLDPLCLVTARGVFGGLALQKADLENVHPGAMRLK